MNRKRAAAAAAIVMLVAHGSDAQESDDPAKRGAAVYAAKCSFCHDRLPDGGALEMLPGVASLTLKYDGTLSPYIKERPDLANAQALAGFLRNGSGSMPPFRKTEVSDADIAAIAAYFMRTSSGEPASERASR